MTNLKKAISNLFLTVVILFFTVSCTNENAVRDLDQEIISVNLVANKQKYDDADTARKSGNGNSISDNFIINGTEREGDILKISVTYTGGCKEHTFDVIWNGLLLLSYPCQIGLLITHDALGDNCEASLTEILEVDLKALIGDNEYKDACTYYVYSVLNESDAPDSIVTSGN